MKELRVAKSVLVAAVLAAVLWVSAGDLNPPAGPIAPTMKDLATVEPRIPISNASTPGDADSLFKISAPGSYYLTGNITGVNAKHGIEISASDVTLDLMGFRIANANFAGIRLEAVSNVAIRNGTIQGCSDGINGFAATRVHVHNLLVSSNSAGGIQLGDEAVVTDCTASFNCCGGSNGITVGSRSVVRGCTASNNGNEGIQAVDGSTVEGCTASSNLNRGIVIERGTVTACSTYSNSVDGIACNRSTVRGCTSNNNVGDGIEALNFCFVTVNSCDANGAGIGDGAGVHVTGAANRIDGNNVTGNDRGIDVDVSGNLIIRNSAAANTVAYDISAGNTSGPTVAAGGIATSDNPHANYSY